MVRVFVEGLDESESLGVDSSRSRFEEEVEFSRSRRWYLFTAVVELDGSDASGRSGTYSVLFGEVHGVLRS